MARAPRPGNRAQRHGIILSGCGPVVGRFVRDEEVGSSNLPTPTKATSALILKFWPQFGSVRPLWVPSWCLNPIIIGAG